MSELVVSGLTAKYNQLVYYAPGKRYLAFEIEDITRDGVHLDEAHGITAELANVPTTPVINSVTSVGSDPASFRVAST